jgi:hypothetical protein
VLLLPPPLSIYLDEEVAFDDEEGIDDDATAEADDTDANDYVAAPAAAANDDSNNATMPPKVKPLPTKPTKKDMATASAKPSPPATAAATTSFSIDATDPLTAHYYANGVYDNADVVFHVNGTMQKSEYQVRVAEDGLSVLFVRAISSMSYDKRILPSPSAIAVTAIADPLLSPRCFHAYLLTRRARIHTSESPPRLLHNSLHSWRKADWRGTTNET